MIVRYIVAQDIFFKYPAIIGLYGNPKVATPLDKFPTEPTMNANLGNCSTIKTNNNVAK